MSRPAAADQSLEELERKFDADAMGFAGRKRLQKVTGNGPTSSDANAVKLTPQWMDTERKNLAAYEYLCRVGEAKQWIEAVIQEDIGAVVDMSQLLRDGVILAKLARFFQPDCVKRVFEDKRLQFRHSDNVNYFFAATKKAGLPDLFLFELTDVYDRKNIPKVIYCIHALSHYLAKKGIAPKIKNLTGELDFTEEELERTEQGLLESGLPMPHFGSIEGALAKELDEPSAEDLRRDFLQAHMEEIIKCQAMARGHLVRSRMRAKREHWASNEALIAKTQARVRGGLQRRAYQEIMDHYKSAESLAKIVKLQAWLKGKSAGKAYKDLDAEDIPVKTIQAFIHLLDDSARDFDEEKDLEKLKYTVINLIRENNQMEQMLGELDVKIALLVRNRTTIDEVFKSGYSSKSTSVNTSKNSLAGSRKSLMLSSSSSLFGTGAPTSPTLPNADLFSAASFRALDKDSRQRLELYGNLFYILQTRPTYLARAVFLVKQSRFRGFMDHVLLTLFNFANSAREEYLLLRLFAEVIREELKSVPDVGELLKGNPVMIRMIAQYLRGTKERQFLRDLLQPLVKEVIGNAKLDLESDPLQIYRQLIKEEESRSGEASTKSFDIPREEALADADVRQVYDEHQTTLRELTDRFLDAIVSNVQRMPYGLRLIARTLYREMMTRYPGVEEEPVLKVLGNLVYYRYMNPAVVAPEGFDVIETLVSPLQRKNLAEIAKLLQHVSVAATTEDTSVMPEMSAYIASASQRLFAALKQVIDIPEPEDFYGQSGYADASTTSKPVIYIAPQEIYNTHALLMENVDDIAGAAVDDPLRTILQLVGTLPDGSVTTDYTGHSREPIANESPADKLQGGNEFALTLASRILDQYTAATETPGGDAGADFRSLLLETKRLVLMLIRVQSGKNLVEIVESPLTEADEKHYCELLEAEHKLQREDSGIVEEGGNVCPKTLREAKEMVAKNLASLEQMYAAFDPSISAQLLAQAPTRANNYVALLTAIGADIRNKHRRRLQRRQEITALEKTVQSLQSKLAYLEEQKQSYNDYVTSCMAQLSNSRKKNPAIKTLVPFTPQWFHQQELKKQGKVPRFGSFKYTAEQLYKKGVLLSIDGQSQKNYDKIAMTISSDESGVFRIEVTIMGVPMPHAMELKLEDLLQYQFDNQQVIPLFEGAATANVNLLVGGGDVDVLVPADDNGMHGVTTLQLYLVNKKFYQ